MGIVLPITPADRAAARIAASLKALGLASRNQGRTIEVADELAVSIVTVQAAGEKAAEGPAVEAVVRLRTLPTGRLELALRSLPPHLAGLLNTLAPLGVVLAEGDIGLHVRLPLHAGDADGHRLCAGIAAALAGFHAMLLPHFLGPLVDLEIGPPAWPTEPSPLADHRLDELEALLQRSGLLGSRHGDLLTAYLPPAPRWSDHGYVLRSPAIFRATGAAEHPMFGAGTGFRLVSAVELDETEGLLLADALNRADLQAIEAPPMLGAWYFEPQARELVHGGFVPAALTGIVPLDRLFAWSMARAHRAMAWAPRILGRPTLLEAPGLDEIRARLTRRLAVQGAWVR